jgi:hypothetical protein
MYGSGVGTGDCEEGGASRIENITAWNATILMCRSRSGSGIGTGFGQGAAVIGQGSATGQPEGGEKGPGSVSSLGLLLIAGSHVEGSISTFGSAIGTGESSDDGTSEIEKVTIWNSTVVESRSYWGSGIGTGYVEAGTSCNSSIGVLLISSSQIEGSSSVFGSGIGSGWAYDVGSASSIGNLLISESHVETSSSFDGCGIGTGTASAGGTSTIENATIWCSVIVGAHSDSSGSGIGTGFSAFGSRSSIGLLLISSSHIERISSLDGSGIGTGCCEGPGRSTIDNLSICSSHIRSTESSNGVAIGSGLTEGEVGSLVFSGYCWIECTANGQIAPVNATSMMISHASLTFITDGPVLFGRSPQGQGLFDLVIGYRRATYSNSEELSSLEGPFLHIGDLSTPDSGSHFFEFCARRSSFERCLNDTSGRIRSVIVRSGSQGNYSFPGWLNGVCGHFEPSDSITELGIDMWYSFISVLSFVLDGNCRFPATPIIDLSQSSSNSLLELPRISDASDPSVDEAGSASAVVIGLGSTLAVLLIIVIAVVLIVGCGHRFARSATDATESGSDLGMPRDGNVVAPTIASIVSEENALTADGSTTNRKALIHDDRDESHIAHSRPA